MYDEINDSDYTQQVYYTGSPAMQEETPGQETPVRESAPVYENAPKKKSFASRFFGILFSGLLFGICAGLAIVVMLRLFPQKTDPVLRNFEKPPVEIETAKPVMPEEAGEASQGEQDKEAAGEEAAVENEAAASEDAQAKERPLTVVTDVTKVVDSVMPAVVSIFGTYEVTESYWGFEMQREEDGSGSGIIVGENDEELLVVTNNHVVADSTALTVQFIDNEKYDAVVKGTDSDADLAVIAIRKTELKDATRAEIKIATLGDSDKLKVGEPAIAIGNALGYGQSVTSGVISAVNRPYTQSEDGREAMLIQTDAAINPGNSGGALLNIYGEVIGINSNKIGGMVIEGMGYAIPISTAKPILEDLMSKKTRLPVTEEQKGYLGISGINVTEDVKQTYGLPIGVYIAQVFDGTPAQKVGLKKGDIIVSFDGEKVETMEELTKLLDATPAGQEIEMQVMSSGFAGYEEKTVTVVLEARY